MQKKLAASFLLVACLYLGVSLSIPRLQPDPLWSTILIVSLYLVIGLGSAWFVSSLLTRRIRDLAAATTVISRGDLTRRIDTSGSDEVADLARSFSAMLESLLNVVLEVRATAGNINESARALSGTSEEINCTAEEIAGATENIASGAEEQASRVEETNSVTRNLALSADRIAESALDVHRATSAAKQRASSGAEEARQAASSIEAFAEKTSSVALAVEGFRTKANDIGKIITSISSIAHQTHLLAINAAIESVRAGEDGRGFAVVADEISRLADDVNEFSEQISALSEEIILGSRDVADGIRLSVEAAEQVRQVVDQTAAAFENLQKATTGSSMRAEEISQLTDDQRVAAGDVSVVLNRLSLIASENAAGTEQTSAATRGQIASMQEMTRSAYQLAETSTHLKELISMFRTE